MRKFFNWLLSGIGGTIIAIIVPKILDSYFNEPFLWNKVLWCWDKLKLFFSINIPLWIAILMIIAVFIAIKIFRIVKRMPKEPKFVNYREDSFDGFFWRWEWHKKEDEKYEVKDLIICCPIDKTSLSPHAHSFVCPKCKKTYNYGNLYIRRDVEVLIEDKIRNGTYLGG
ncbi:hypothetical protein EZS27_009376 [termite gut metagenome]|uniref:Uncharacterized protein n=1 Tax=termite gut metagenome TaxID=433724 RepID=A0A5J4S9R1_9ZZZZ